MLKILMDLWHAKGTTGSAPTTDGTKVFSTVWLGFATLALGHMVSKIIGYKLSSKIHSIRDRVLTHALDKDFFNDIDASNGVVDGEIDRAEWLCYNLLKGERVGRCVHRTCYANYECSFHPYSAKREKCGL